MKLNKGEKIMSLKKNIITLLPDKWQDQLLARVIASNNWRKVPTFNMLFESYSIMGADRDDMVKAFSNSTDLNKDFYINCRVIAKNREKNAEKMTGNLNEARKEYFKALILYFLADWVSFEENQICENYQDLLAVTNKIDNLAAHKTEKIFFSWKKGKIAARFRYPDSDGSTFDSMRNKKYPVIIIVQGNDTVKECFIMLEDMLLNNGFAVLNVDQSGWGESRLTGNRFESLNDAKVLANMMLDFLKSNPHIDETKKSLFGFSGGGTWSAMTAGTDQRFDHMVLVGGGIYDLVKMLHWLPAIQKRQVMKHWGCKKSEIRGISRSELDFNNKILPNITAKCLLVHGEKDTLAPVEGIYKAKELIKGPVELKIIPGGNHMCSDTLMDQEMPFIMKWLHEKFR
ncbi:MAG: hypothetical protein K0S75_464 [Clostridia bacterium]|jgi:dienelactone hydrolase|nr:hypothetical protein [Clostridia bacterium]